MHVLILFILAILTIQYWLPVVGIGVLAVVAFWIFVALPFFGVRRLYRWWFPIRVS